MSRQQYEPLARQKARQYGIDEEVFLRQINQESGWRPDARSGAGAAGLLQLMPGTARGLGVSNPYDPEQSLDGGARYLSQQLKKYGGNYRKALAAYNAGPGNVDKYGGVPPFPETQRYVTNILANRNPTNRSVPNDRAQPRVANPYRPARNPRAGSSSQTVAAKSTGGLSDRDMALAGIVFEDDPDFLTMLSASNTAQEPEPVRAPARLPGVGVGPVAAGPVRGGSGGKVGEGLIAAARSEVGKTAADAMTYIRAAGGTGNEPWCGDFVMAMFAKRGLKPPPARYVPTLLNWAKQNQTFTTQGRRGDLVIFDWKGDGVPDHVGIVTGRNKDGSYKTIEGNTSGTGGMGVYQKTRQRSQILGFART